MKRFLWSITNIGKYDEMIELGLKKAIKYFIILVIIFSFILSLALSYLEVKNVRKIEQYINEKIPEFNVSKGEGDVYKLTVDGNETIILEDEIIKNIFRSIIVLNTNLEEKEAINEYYKLATDSNNCIVLLQDKCIILSASYNIESDSNDGMLSYTYDELIQRWMSNENTEVHKSDLLNYFHNMSYSFYLIVYFVTYMIILLLIFGLDAIIAGILSIIANVFIKLDKTKKQLFSLSIYSLTLPSVLYIIYLLISSFTGYVNKYVNVIYMTIVYLYIILYFYRKKHLHKEK